MSNNSVAYRVGSTFIGNSERQPICTIQAIGEAWIDYCYPGFIVDIVESMVPIEEFEKHLESGLWKIVTY